LNQEIPWNLESQGERVLTAKKRLLLEYRLPEGCAKDDSGEKRNELTRAYNRHYSKVPNEYRNQMKKLRGVAHQFYCLNSREPKTNLKAAA